MRKAKTVAFLGLMLGIMLALTTLEHALPPLPFLPPNVKLGLSNIVAMYAVFFVGKTAAAGLNGLKSFFVLLIRGPVAGLLSFCGGMLSIAVIILLAALFRERISYAAVSVLGAIAHNMGQFAVVRVMIGPAFILYYLPILIVSGIVMGVATGALLKAVLPVLGKILNGGAFP